MSIVDLCFQVYSLAVAVLALLLLIGASYNNSKGETLSRRAFLTAVYTTLYAAYLIVTLDKGLSERGGVEYLYIALMSIDIAGGLSSVVKAQKASADEQTKDS